MPPVQMVQGELLRSLGRHVCGHVGMRAVQSNLNVLLPNTMTTGNTCCWGHAGDALPSALP